MTSPYVTPEVYAALDKALKKLPCEGEHIANLTCCDGTGLAYPNGVASWIEQESEQLVRLKGKWVAVDGVEPVLTTMQALEIARILWKGNRWEDTFSSIERDTQQILGLLEQIAKEELRAEHT